MVTLSVAVVLFVLFFAEEFAVDVTAALRVIAGVAGAGVGAATGKLASTSGQYELSPSNALNTPVVLFVRTHTFIQLRPFT